MRRSNTIGFTLIEVLVSIAILMILTIAASLYFRSNNTATYARNAAATLSDALRTAQNYAQAGLLVNGKVPPAFGVKVATVSGVPTAIIYAESSIPANNTYDAGEAYPDTTKGTIVLDQISLTNKRSSTDIASIQTDASVVPSVDIAFTTPTASMMVNGGTTVNLVTVSFEKGTVIKKVSIDRTTGRIQSDF